VFPLLAGVRRGRLFFSATVISSCFFKVKLKICLHKMAAAFPCFTKMPWRCFFAHNGLPDPQKTE
jgi:hypothetical protein